MKTTNYNVVGTKNDRIRDAQGTKLSAAARERLVADYDATIVDIPWTSTMEEILKSHDNVAGKPARYPLFWRGLTAQAVLNAVLPVPENLSQVTREVDLDKIDTIGTQGVHFSTDYMLPRYLEYYSRKDGANRVPFCSDAMGYNQRYVVDQVKQFFLDAIGGNQLTPLSWEAACSVVCSKYTASFPTGGLKSDPAVREWVLGEQFDPNAPVLGGQRYQRNKRNSNGDPEPRCIFNADIRAVVAAARYEAPLVALFQRLADDGRIIQGLSTSEARGPKSVGQALKCWAESRPNMTFRSIEVDVSGMDKCFTLEHAKVCYDIIAPLFTETDGLWESIAYSFTADLIVSRDVVLRGEHGIFSGVTWVHMLENIMSMVLGLSIKRLLHIRVKGKTWTYSDIDYWKDTLILMSGDDLAVVVAIPESAEFGVLIDRDGVEESIPATHDDIIDLYARWGFKTKSEKIHIRRNYVNFCSKTYRPGVVIKESESGATVAWRPVYSVVSAIEAVYYPEYSLEVPSLTAEILRVAAIVDQTYGHQCWAALVASLCNSLADEDRHEVQDAVTAIGPDTDIVRVLGKSLTWSASIGEWTIGSSPFIRELKSFLGLATANADVVDVVRGQLFTLKRSSWFFGLDLSKIAAMLRELGSKCDCSSGDVKSAEAYANRLEALTAETVDDSGSPCALYPERVIECSKTGIGADSLAEPRMITEYDASRSYQDNLTSSTPMSDRIARAKRTKQSGGGAHAVKPAGLVIRVRK